MSTKFFALAALLVLPVSAQARWAHETTDLSQPDLHVMQMCEGTYSECFDIHHMEHNALHIEADLKDVSRFYFLAGQSTSKKDYKFAMQAMKGSIETVKLDRQYLVKLFKLTQMSDVKKQIAEQIKIVDETIADESGPSAPSKKSRAVR